MNVINLSKKNIDKKYIYTFNDWSEYLYKLLVNKINNNFNIDNKMNLSQLILDNDNLSNDNLSNDNMKKNIFISNIIFSNKNFDLVFFNKHSELIIDYELLSYNPNITFDYIIENKYCLWSDVILNKILGKNIINYTLYNKYYNEMHKFYKFDILYELFETWDNLLYIEKKFGHKIKYNILSMNKNISWDIIINNIHKDWNFEYLVIYNQNITIDIVLNNKKYFNDKCIKLLSKNKNIKWQDIIKYNNIDWNYTDLSLNRNITFDIVLNNLDKNWCFNRLSSNPNITIDIILKYNNFQWSIYWYSFNPNIRLNDIDKIKFTNYTPNKNLIIKNLFLNNYDIDRNEYFQNNNIQIDQNLINILNNDNFELVIY